MNKLLAKSTSGVYAVVGLNLVSLLRKTTKLSLEAM